MSTAILACTNLVPALEAAQRAMGTAYPVIPIDRLYHREPKEMREHLLEALESLPEEIDTLLVAMGFCGGSWQDVTCPCRMVFPRVDDCVTLLLTCDEDFCFNRKEPGHMYATGSEDTSFSVGRIYESLMEQFQDKDQADAVFDMWFANYGWLDVIDTGLYDCYDETLVERFQEDADRFNGELGFVPGGILLLEKLVSGRWDEQFLLAEKGTRLTQGKFLE